MAKEESRGEFSDGLEIEIDGEVLEGGSRADGELPGDDAWELEAVERGQGLWPSWRTALDEHLQTWWDVIRRRLTWQIVAWVAAAAVLGFGVGALGEPTAKQVAQQYLSTDFGLNFDNDPITAPGQAQMASLAGAAWSISPVTTLVVHVVNDGDRTLRLRTGTLAGQRIASGSLAPDGTGVLAPGQHGTLTAHVAVSCANGPAPTPDPRPGAAAVPRPAAGAGAGEQPLTAQIPVSADTGPSAVVRLVSGTVHDDLYVASQLCAGLPTPLTVSFNGVTTSGGAGSKSAAALQVTLHNITGQTISYALQPGYQSLAPNAMTITPGSTIVADVSLAQECSSPGGALNAPNVLVNMSTLNGAYQTSYAVGVSSAAQDSAACDG
jgi:hypothetical protein